MRGDGFIANLQRQKSNCCVKWLQTAAISKHPGRHYLAEHLHKSDKNRISDANLPLGRKLCSAAPPATSPGPPSAEGRPRRRRTTGSSEPGKRLRPPETTGQRKHREVTYTSFIFQTTTTTWIVKNGYFIAHFLLSKHLYSYFYI